MRALLALLLLACAARAEPTRIVSLNPCLDAVLVAVADRDQIAALSHYARDPHGSTIADLARTYPETFESAEEVLALRPDLVLASRHSSPATRSALTRFGVTLELFAVPNTIATSVAQVTRIAALAGHPERGAALVADIEAALATSAPPPGAEPIPALIFQPGGFVAGPGTLAGAMLEQAGFANQARRYGLDGWGHVSLEQLLADPPRLLLSDGLESGAPSLAERMLTHPALKSIAGRMRRADFPERLLYCGGPALIEAAGVLRAARQRLEPPA